MIQHVILNGAITFWSHSCINTHKYYSYSMIYRCSCTIFSMHGVCVLLIQGVFATEIKMESSNQHAS